MTVAKDRSLVNANCGVPCQNLLGPSGDYNFEEHLFPEQGWNQEASCN